jgi:hypothetical protein
MPSDFSGPGRFLEIVEWHSEQIRMPVDCKPMERPTNLKFCRWLPSFISGPRIFFLLISSFELLWQFLQEKSFSFLKKKILNKIHSTIGNTIKSNQNQNAIFKDNFYLVSIVLDFLQTLEMYDEFFKNLFVKIVFGDQRQYSVLFDGFDEVAISILFMCY